MSLQISHDTQAGTVTLRWRIYATEQRDILLGFVDGERKLRTMHPDLEAIDGALWGPNLQQQIIDAMKASMAKNNGGTT